MIKVLTTKWYALLAMIAVLGVAQVHAQEMPAGPVAEADDVAVTASEGVVDLEFNDVSVKVALQALAAARKGTSVVPDPDVTGNVTMTLEKVTWERALQLITDSQGLEYRKEGNIYRVYRPKRTVDEDIVVELYTAAGVEQLSDAEVLRLVSEEGVTVEEARAKVEGAPYLYIKRLSVDNRPALDVVSELAKKAGLNYTFSPRAGRPEQPPADQGQQQQQAQEPESPPISLNLRDLSVERAIVLVADQGGLSATKQEGVWVISQLSPKQRQIEPLKLETFQVNFIPLDNDLVNIMKMVTTERGTVSRGKNKILIVKDTKEGIDAVRQTLEVMDKPTPQVLIEARFFQINNSDEMKIGVDWQDLGSEGGASFGAKTADLTYDYWDSKKAIDPAAAAIGAFDAEDARTAVLSLPDFSVVLHALRANNQAEELANPKIVVSSDEQATIHIGEQRPIIQTDIESTSTGAAIVSYELDDDYGGEVVEELMLSPEAAQGRGRTYRVNKGYLDLGTKLTVLPSVKTEEEVYIRVVPELMSFIEDVSFPLQGGEGETISTIDFPKLFRTYVRTQFTVKSGQTIAIGGLVSKRKTMDENKVPLLGDIPYFGRAFRYNQESVTQSETIIFLTVKIMAGKELNVVSGIPIRSRGIQDEVETIQQEDARGAVYDPEYVRELIDMLEGEPDAEEAEERLRDELRSKKHGEEDDEAAGELAEEGDAMMKSETDGQPAEDAALDAAAQPEASEVDLTGEEEAEGAEEAVEETD